MQEVSKWWSEIGGRSGKDWLIAGKGPSFARRSEFDLDQYRVIALNHTIREVKAEVAHAIDLDVIQDCAEAIQANSRFMLAPRYPHIDGVATDQPLESFFSKIPALKELSEAGRLVWYNLGSGKDAGGSPRIEPGQFSAEMVGKLIIALGAKRFRTLGVDGGTAYAENFSDLDASTRLKYGQKSFSTQFKGLNLAAHAAGAEYGPLGADIPIHVYVGTDDTQMLGARVLHYSILQHTSMSVVFNTMEGYRHRIPRDVQNRPRTGFSFTRFMIPEKMGFKGRALYVDADMMIFQDLRKLWEIDLGEGGAVGYVGASQDGRPPQFSVCVLQCDRLPWNVERIVDDLDAGKYGYKHLMSEFCIAPEGSLRPVVPTEWNSLEIFEPGKTCLLHYTDMPLQPWVSRQNRLKGLWLDTLTEAVFDGFIKPEEIKEAIRLEYARPSLWADVQSRLARRSWLMHRVWFHYERFQARTADTRFQPHKKAQEHQRQLGLVG